ncbi:MAG: hypothetical protein CL882_01660 [Dehalococcoidia bacterium]|nr:hypothetical protein [Dehalococcoidia bacterium]
MQSVRRGRLGAVFEWGDVFGTQTKKRFAVKSEQGAGDLHPQGRFSECAEVASEQDCALLERLRGWVESGAVRHHSLTVGAYHQEGFGDDAVDLQLRRKHDRHTIVVSHAIPAQESGDYRELVETMICRQNRVILGLTSVIFY